MTMGSATLLLLVVAVSNVAEGVRVDDDDRIQAGNATDTATAAPPAPLAPAAEKIVGPGTTTADMKAATKPPVPLAPAKPPADENSTAPQLHQDVTGGGKASTEDIEAANMTPEATAAPPVPIVPAEHVLDRIVGPGTSTADMNASEAKGQQPVRVPTTETGGVPPYQTVLPSKEVLEAESAMKGADAKIKESDNEIKALKTQTMLKDEAAAKEIDASRHVIDEKKKELQKKKEEAKGKLDKAQKDADEKLANEKKKMDTAVNAEIKALQESTEEKCQEADKEARERQRKAKQVIEENKKVIKADEAIVKKVEVTKLAPGMETQLSAHEKKVEAEVVKAKALAQLAVDKKAAVLEHLKEKADQQVDKASASAETKTAEVHEAAMKEGQLATIAGQKKLNKIKESVQHVKAKMEQEKAEEEQTVSQQKVEEKKSKQKTKDECKFEDGISGSQRGKVDCDAKPECHWHKSDDADGAFCTLKPEEAPGPVQLQAARGDAASGY